MKKLVLVFAMFVGLSTFAQEVKVKDITSKNSWLKLGLNAGVPMGDADDLASFALGLDVKGQFLVTPNFGIGLATGYSHMFGKDGADDFGIIPAAGFARYYFQKTGLFIGADLGYGFLMNVDNNEGGLYVSPQIGYHNEDWNIFAFYQNTFAENDFDIRVLGIGATYNLRF